MNRSSRWRIPVILAGGMILIGILIAAEVIAKNTDPSKKGYVRREYLVFWALFTTTPYLLTAASLLLARAETVRFWLVSCAAALVATCGVGIILGETVLGGNELIGESGLIVYSLLPAPFVCLALVLSLVEWSEGGDVGTLGDDPSIEFDPAVAYTPVLPSSFPAVRRAILRTRLLFFVVLALDFFLLRILG